MTDLIVHSLTISPIILVNEFHGYRPSIKGDSLCKVSVLCNMAHWQMQQLCHRPFQDSPSAHANTETSP